MVNLRTSGLAALVFLLSLPFPAAAQTPPAAAQTPAQLRGIWIARDRSDEISRLSIAQAGAEVTWRRRETVKCEMVTQADRLPPTLVVATFRCATSAGLLQLGITRPPEGLLLVNFVSPADPDMKHLVFVRPTAAPKPRPPTDTAGDARPPVFPAPPPDAIPQFPWPPPRWTLRTVLPSELGVAAEGE